MIRKNLIIFYMVIQALLFVGGCATLPEDFEKPESYAYTDTDDTRLGSGRRNEINAHPGQSGFLLLGSGLDAFLARALLAENADRSIDASTISITMISSADCLPIYCSRQLTGVSECAFWWTIWTLRTEIWVQPWPTAIPTWTCGYLIHLAVKQAEFFSS